MKSKLILTCAVVAISLCLLACAAVTKEASVSVSSDELMNAKHVSTEVEVAVDGSLKVTLCSNPTTGFQWTESAQISDRTILKQTDHKFVPPGGDIPGAPGQEVWTFETLKEGTCSVSMEYSRPWEGGEKGEWTFNLTVVVK